MAFTKKELEKQAADNRKQKSLRQSRPEKSVAGKELARIVAKKTGYQIKQTTEIVDAVFDTVFLLLQEKKQVLFPKIGSIHPRVKKARKSTMFYKGTGKKPTQFIAPPTFKLEIIFNKNLQEVIKKLPVSKEEVENMYVNESE